MTNLVGKKSLYGPNRQREYRTHKHHWGEPILLVAAHEGVRDNWNDLDADPGRNFSPTQKVQKTQFLTQSQVSCAHTSI